MKYIKKISNSFSTSKQIHPLRNPLRNVYIHIPFCRRKCHYCAFPIHAVGSNPIPSQALTLYSTYLSHLTTQISSFKHPFSPPLQTLYLGGGTPSLLPASMLKDILSRFPLGETEVSIEMMPNQSSEIEKFKEVGINRFSIGVQTTNQDILENVHRGGYQRDKLLGVLSQYTDLNLNIDMMIGLNESEKDRQEMLDFIQRISPRQVTIYMLELNEGSYMHRNGYTFGKQLTKTQEISKAYENICLKMDQMSYDHYEISTFSKRGTPLSKHNLVYWEGNKDFAAFGMGATSLLGGLRETRPKRLASYYRFVNGQEKLQSTEDENIPYEKLAARLLSRLRTKKGIKYRQLETEFGEIIRDKLKSKICQMAKQNNEIFNCSVLDHKIELNPINGFLCCDLIVYKLLDTVS